jgi:hypothetical protein
MRAASVRPTALATVSSTNSTGKGINIDGAVGGTIMLNGGAITGSANEAFDVNLGDAAITYAGSITKASAGRLVDITNRTGGSVTLTGNLNGSGGGHTGINLNGNAGTYTFSGAAKTLDTGANNAVTLDNNDTATIGFPGGGLAITTTSGNGFHAVNGAADISVGGSANTISTTTTGTALHVVNSTIGAGNLNFQSISAGPAAGAGPATHGINLDTVGTGTLIVTGTGVTAGSGGTIRRASQHGLRAVAVNNLSLTNMNFTANGLSQSVAGSAATCGGDLRAGNNLNCVANIHIQNATTATFNRLSVTNSGQMGINGNNVSGVSISNSTITGNGTEAFENGVHFQNLTGTNSIANTIIRDNASRQIHVANIAGGTTSTLSISGTRTNNAHPTQDTSTTMIGNSAPSGAFTQQGLLMEAFGGANIGMTLNLDGVVMNNNFPANATDIQHLTSGTLGGTTQNSAFDFNAGGVILAMQNAANGTYNVTNNEFNRAALQSILYAGANPYTGTLQGTISGNTIGTTGQAGSACQPPGAANCHGIDVNFIGGSGRIALRVAGNDIREFDGTGMSFVANGAGVVDANITSNTLTAQAGEFPIGISTNMGTTAGASVAGCFGITGNVTNGTFSDPGAGTQFGITTIVRFNSTHRLPGYGGAANNAATATAFISGNNPGAAGEVYSQYFGMPPGYTGGAACNTP